VSVELVPSSKGRFLNKDLKMEWNKKGGSQTIIVGVVGGSLRYGGLRHDARGSERWLGGDDGGLQRNPAMLSFGLGAEGSCAQIRTKKNQIR
jgi:hypothetical protein